MAGGELGATIATRLGLAPVNVVAGGAADNVDQNGTPINVSNFRDAVVAVPFGGNLGAGQSVTVRARVQARPDGGAFADVPGESANVTVNSDGGGAVSGILEIDSVDVDRVDGDEIRVVASADLSAGVTDAAMVSAVVILGDPVSQPV